MTDYRSIVTHVRAFVNALPLFALLAMLLIVVTSSIGRYIFSSPIPNTVELVELILLPTVIWAYAANVQYREKNITMDLVSSGLGDGRNQAVKLLYYPFLAGILLVAFVGLAESTVSLWHDNAWSMGTISIPMYVSRGITTLGVLSLIIVIAVQIVQWARAFDPLAKIRAIRPSRNSPNDD